MNTQEIMKLALQLADLKKIPEDSAIYVKGEKLKKILVAIDAGVPELLLAKQLECDAVIAHHPQGGTSITNFHQVFRRHIQQMVKAGIPRTKAEETISKKLKTLEVEGHARNYSHAVEVAKLLKMPYMNIHTPLDEIGRRMMATKIAERTDRTSRLSDVVAALDELPEFRRATTKIRIRIGKPETPAGRIAVSHGAGTNGGYEIAEAYFKHGIGTVVYIHISPADLERLQAKNHGNLIVTGHIASDSVGINPFIHMLENERITVERIGIVPD